jgi:hypothetical protein
MSRVRWRWKEKDFGFRFRSGSGRQATEFYQTSQPSEFYVVPIAQRKLNKKRSDEFAAVATVPKSPKVVPNPWQNYNRDWDWIQTEDGICLNYAGCLERNEIDRREDEGVARALEYIASLLSFPNPVLLPWS